MPQDSEHPGASNEVERQQVAATILFVDIVDSLGMANYLSPASYDDVLSEFYEITGQAVARHVEFGGGEVGLEDIIIRGDEVCILFHSGELRSDIEGALGLASEIKVKWLLSDINGHREAEGKPPVEVAAGIHHGPVLDVTRPEVRRYDAGGEDGVVLLPDSRRLEGFAVSVAKRIEGHARNGQYSRIALSHTVYDLVSRLDLPVQCHWLGRVRLGGVAQPWPIYEVKSCETLAAWVASHDDEAIDRLRAFARLDPRNVWLLATIAETHRYRGEDSEAIVVCRQALEVDDGLLYAQVSLADGLSNTSQWGEGLETIDKAVSAGASGEMVHVIRSSCLIGLDRLGEAEKECQLALRTEAESEGAFYNLACIRVREGRHDEAIEYLQKSISIRGERVVEVLIKDKDGDFAELADDERFRAMLSSQSNE